MSNIIQLEHIVIPRVLNTISERSQWLNMALATLQEKYSMNLLSVTGDIRDDLMTIEVRPQENN